MKNYREQTHVASPAFRMQRDMEREQSMHEDESEGYAACHHPVTTRYRGDTVFIMNTPDENRRNQDTGGACEPDIVC